MEDRKQLWRAIQLYTRSVGLVMKKLPVSLLKKADLFDEDSGALSQGDRALRAVRKYRKLGLHSDARKQLKDLAGVGLRKQQADLLAAYVEDVFSNWQYSRNFNLYVAFAIKKTSPHAGELEVAGVIGTGAFNPHRADDDAPFSLRPAGVTAGSRPAEIELLVAKSGFGKALAMWGLGDLLMRSTTGQPRYTQVLTFASTSRSKQLFQRLGFHRVETQEYHVGSARPIRSRESCFALHNQAGAVQGLWRTLKSDRAGLYTLCPTGPSVPLWQRCK